jgi:hypothetical protein
MKLIRHLALALFLLPPTTAAAQRAPVPRLQLGDLILRNSDGAVLRIGLESHSMSPTGDFRRELPITITFEAVSTVERPNAFTRLAIVGNAGRDSLPVLQIRFPSPVSVGNATIQHELNVSHLTPGRFRLDLTLADSATGQVVQRQSFLMLK